MDGEKQDLFMSFQRLLAIRTVVAEELELDYKPHVVVTSTMKDVEMTARKLGLRPQHAYLWDDNKVGAYTPAYTRPHERARTHAPPDAADPRAVHHSPCVLIALRSGLGRPAARAYCGAVCGDGPRVPGALVLVSGGGAACR